MLFIIIHKLESIW